MHSLLHNLIVLSDTTAQSQNTLPHTVIKEIKLISNVPQ